jgi:GDP-L-fucose synthase
MSNQRLYIAGHTGMVGSALVRSAPAAGWTNVVTATRAEVDLTRQAEVEAFVGQVRPKVVIMAAARVGGILANRDQPASFLYENLAMTQNVIEASRRAGVERLLFLGSSCIYPRLAPQPMPEECLLTSALEPTNEAYAIAKIAGLKMCAAYRRQHGVLFHSAMPTNLYGPGVNYHPDHSHVLPGLLRRFHEAARRGDPSVTIWGTGTPRREFLHVDDLAAACFHLLGVPTPPDWVNVGVGEDVSILEAAHLVAETVGFTGTILTDPTKPDGTPRKLLDVARLHALGWRARTSLRDGLRHTYKAFLTDTQSGAVRVV